MRTLSGACMSQRLNRSCQDAISLLDRRLALLAHELSDIIGTERALAAGAGAYPPAKRLHALPGAGGRAAAAIAVGHARLDFVEKFLLLLFVVGKDAGRQPILAVVGQLDRLVERFD